MQEKWAALSLASVRFSFPRVFHNQQPKTWEQSIAAYNKTGTAMQLDRDQDLRSHRMCTQHTAEEHGSESMKAIISAHLLKISKNITDWDHCDTLWRCCLEI